MKTRKKLTLGKVLIVVFTLALCFAMCSFAVGAADETHDVHTFDAETYLCTCGKALVVLDVGKINDQIHFFADGYVVGESATGTFYKYNDAAYILTGYGWRELYFHQTKRGGASAENRPFDVTIRDLHISTAQYATAIVLGNTVTLNLSIEGNNEIYAGGSAAIQREATGSATLNIVAVNGSMTLSRLYGNMSGFPVGNAVRGIDSGINKGEPDTAKYTYTKTQEGTDTFEWVGTTGAVTISGAHNEGYHTFSAYEDACPCGAVIVSEKSFPDANFRAWISAKTYGADGILNAEEIAAITDIDVQSQNIASLKGIEYFTALKTLNCGSNKLTSLDISKNTALETLRCHNNKLTSLDVSKNTALTSLQCYTNQLTSLDVSNNKALVYLYCQENKLTSLDLSQNTAIKILYCNNNALISLDLSANTSMTSSTEVGNQTAYFPADIEAGTVTLPAYVDMSKVTVTSGATLNGGILELDAGATEVVYTYATGFSGKTLTVTLKVIPTFESVNIALGKDIKINYYVTKIDGFAIQVKFTINGYTKTVDAVADGDEYKFVFDGVAPHWIGDTIKAELIVDGAVIAEKEYTVLEYLNELKTMSASALGYSEEKYNAMLALIDDLLVYGGAAQAYTGHTGTPVSDGITGTPFEPLTGAHKNVAQGEVVTFKNATLFFDSTNELRFRFTAESTEGLTFGLSINGGAEADIAYTAEGGKYLIKTDAIYATGFDDVYTLTAYVNGEKDAELTYSVKSYVYAKQGGESAMAELAKATYSYGLSAQAFINADNTAGA